MITLGSILKKIIPSSIITHNLNVSGSILLTFDDGPHPEITPRVLDILEEFDARGLFFIPGNRVQQAPKMLQEIIDRKHGIGNHSYTHTSCADLSYGGIVHEIEQCKDLIYSMTGVTTSLYRPPMGVVTPALLAAAWHCNHKIIRWTFDSGEYSYMRGSSSGELASNFINNGAVNKTILLSHDDKDTIPDFLKTVLPILVDNGFDLKNGLSSLGWNNATNSEDIAA